MAITSYPFEGTPTTEDQYSRLFTELQDTGVASSMDAPDLSVSADGSTLVIAVAPGFAYVQGHGFESTQVENLTVPIPSSGTAIHRVVLRLDPTANEITLALLEGTAGAGPSPLTQDASGIYEMSLARVQVGAGAVAVTQADVVDERLFASTRVGAWLSSSSRPASPRVGEMGYNLEAELYEHWTGVTWEPVSDVVAGTVTMYAGLDVPVGYLPCDGSIYSASRYPRLAGRLGTTFSVEGDAPGTFRTPLINGRFPFGADANRPLGSASGSETVTLTEGNLPQHSHSIDHDHIKTERDGIHDHGYRYSETDGGSAGVFRSGRYGKSTKRDGDTANGVFGDGSDHAHKIPAYAGTSGPAGSDQAFSIMPPLFALNFIIKV